MKKVGIIGGIGPESTVQYYKQTIKEFRLRQKKLGYPELVIHSINMTKMLSYISRNNFKGLVAFLVDKITLLEDAGVDFAVIASNTPHIVFEEVRQKTKLPLISIVVEACKAIQGCGIKTAALFGTKYTMSTGFYEKEASKHEINLVLPKFIDRDYIHDKYMNELVYNHIDPETKQGLLNIAMQLKERKKIEGLILGGTELSLIIGQNDLDDIKVFDTTQIHVNSIVTKMLEGEN